METVTFSVKDTSRNFIVHFLICIFAIGSWISVNGLWVELPLLTAELPEEWKLPSYLAVIIQCGNIGAILYTVGNAYKPRVFKQVSAVYLLVIIGLISSLLLSIFWKETSYIAGVEHSTALFVLVFFLSLVDCTSSVVFTPFMALFKEKYLTPYFIGEGLSGFIPSILALIQGVGQKSNCTNSTNDESFSEPRFSVTIFFVCIFIMMFLCGLSFVLLNHLQICLDEHTIPKSKSNSEAKLTTVKVYNSFDSSTISNNRNVSEEDNFKIILTARKMSLLPAESLKNNLSKTFFIILLCAQSWICFFHTGSLLAVQSYSCLPYGNVAFHLSVTLSSIANPLACFIALFIHIKHWVLITCLFVIGNVCGFYILALAILSPNPPLTDKIEGTVLVVIAWLLCTGCFSFTKLAIAAYLRNRGQRGLLWYGGVTQLGSALGALLMFFLVNVFVIFKRKDMCA